MAENVLLRDMNATLSADSESSSSTLREYGLGAQILAELGLGAIELLTNSPSPKVVGLDAYGLKITGTRGLISIKEEYVKFILPTALTSDQ